MTRLLILTPGEVTRDPRGRRSALAGVRAGFDVVAVCPQTAEPIPMEGVQVVRLGSGALTPSLNRLGLGGMGKQQWALIRELRGLYRLARLARLTLRTAVAARAFRPFGVVHAHEVEMLPAALLLRGRGTRVIYDAHEIYASSEPDPPRVHRAITSLIERQLARRCNSVVTVSGAIAEELERTLRLRRRPAVTLNCPYLVEGVEVRPHGGRLRAVYQGAMGPGRPVSDLFDAATAAPGVDLFVRLANADLESLRAEVDRRGLAARMTVLEPVSPTVLVESLGDFDVGVIFNRPVTRNDELVFPNKLFEYMMAGLAIVAPSLPSLGAFVEEHAIGRVFAAGDPRALGEMLEAIAADAAALLAMRERARELAVSSFNAESQELLLEPLWTG